MYPQSNNSANPYSYTNPYVWPSSSPNSYTPPPSPAPAVPPDALVYDLEDYNGWYKEQELIRTSDDLREERLNQVLERLFDIHADANKDQDEERRLLADYKELTGKERPGFMLQP